MGLPHASLGRTAVLATLIAASLPLASAQAQATTATTTTTVSESDVPLYEVDVPSSCSGEIADVDGDLHFVFHRTNDAAGGFHGVDHQNYQGMGGETSTGVDFRVVGATQDDNFNGREGGASEGMDSERTAHLITQGSTDNTHLHVLAHDTWNANGAHTAQVTKGDVGCIG
jgi:hypothetical protein